MPKSTVFKFKREKKKNSPMEAGFFFQGAAFLPLYQIKKCGFTNVSYQ